MLLALPAQLPALGAEPWHIKEAPVRFSVSISGRPTHGSAGCFLQLPDGGILPKPFPVTRVIDKQGAELKSFTLWQNGQTGMGIVFEDPGQRQDVFVYVIGASNLKIWTPSSGLTPSAFLCTDSDHGTLADAQAMAKLGSVNVSVRYENRAGGAGATVDIPGDLQREGGSSSFYMLAYLDAKDPGKTWVAPMTFKGQSEVLLDGQPVVCQQRIQKCGGSGQWRELAPGLHRLDILNHGGSDWSRSRAAMIFTWQTPRTTAGEMGGVRPKDLPFPGTSMWESRHLHGDEVVRSGRCDINGVGSQDGGPVAYFSMSATHNFWFGDEAPVFVYQLSAFKAGNPENTKYTWGFGDNSRITTDALSWLFKGRMFNTVTLTAVSGEKKSVCSVPFYPYSTVRTSLRDSNAGKAFRAAALCMFKAYSPNDDPTARWDDSMWNNFFRNMELAQEPDLLKYMFENNWQGMKIKLAPDRMERLQDLFVFANAHSDPKGTLQWIARFEKDSELLARMHDTELAIKKEEQRKASFRARVLSSGSHSAGEKGDAGKPADPPIEKKDPHERAMELAVKKAEILMYYVKDFESAVKLLDGVAKSRSDLGEVAKIRLGDVSFLTNNLNIAQRFYGDVQDRVKLSQLANKEVPQPPVAKPGSGLATSKKALNTKGGGKSDSPPGRSPPDEAPVKAADWKVNAIMDVASSETVGTLLEGRYYEEALAALRTWEREFPLSKISSDYILREAKFYMAMGDYTRARAMLEAYCNQVDASNFIPPAVKALIECMQKTNEPRENLKKYCETVKKRLKFHPVANDIDAILATL